MKKEKSAAEEEDAPREKNGKEITSASVKNANASGDGAMGQTETPVPDPEKDPGSAPGTPAY
jgi:hypothetical protein